MPFIEAVRQLRSTDDVIYSHVTLVPEVNGEQKTKPTQHSVKELRSLGISPDILFCRSENPLGRDVIEKISLFTDVPSNGIISMYNVKNVYMIPEIMMRQGILNYIKKRIGSENHELNYTWDKFVQNIKNPTESVDIAIVGKYIELQDAYISHKEAFSHVTGNTGIAVNIHWVDADKLLKSTDELKDVDGILVPGGFGYRGVEGKIIAARYARENNIPYLGICLGFQVSVIEISRSVLGLKNANSTEFDNNTEHPVIDILPEQSNISDLGGTMRLGSKKVLIKDKTLAKNIYKLDTIYERHRHRYEVNPDYIDKLESRGVVFSGTDEEKIRMEILELSDRDNYIATQYHAEFKSRPLSPSKVHTHLVLKALEHRRYIYERNTSGISR